MTDVPEHPIPSNETNTTQPPFQPVVDFREIYNRQAFVDFHQDALYEVLPPNINDLSHFLLAMVDKVRPMLHASLVEKKGVVFWVAVQVAYSHPTKELIDMTPKYLNTGRRTLFHAKDIEDKLDEVVHTILLRNAHFIRDNSGLVLDDILRLHYKADEYLPVVGRAYKVLP